MKQISYILEFQTILDAVPRESQGKFVQIYADRMRNPVIALGLNAYLGFLGADRFYAGDILLGVLKLLTAGGVGIWILVDLFLIAGKIRYKNILLAREIRLSIISSSFESKPKGNW